MTSKIGDFGVFGSSVPAGADVGINEEKFYCYKDHRGRNLCQYDYRWFDGTLFSCVRPTLAECVKARDEWLEKTGRNDR